MYKTKIKIGLISLVLLFTTNAVAKKNTTSSKWEKDCKKDSIYPPKKFDKKNKSNQKRIDNWITMCDGFQGEQVNIPTVRTSKNNDNLSRTLTTLNNSESNSMVGLVTWIPQIRLPELIFDSSYESYFNDLRIVLNDLEADTESLFFEYQYGNSPLTPSESLAETTDDHLLLLLNEMSPVLESYGSLARMGQNLIQNLDFNYTVPTADRSRNFFNLLEAGFALAGGGYSIAKEGFKVDKVLASSGNTVKIGNVSNRNTISTNYNIEALPEDKHDFVSKDNKSILDVFSAIATEAESRDNKELDAAINNLQGPITNALNSIEKFGDTTLLMSDLLLSQDQYFSTEGQSGNSYDRMNRAIRKGTMDFDDKLEGDGFALPMVANWKAKWVNINGRAKWGGLNADGVPEASSSNMSIKEIKLKLTCGALGSKYLSVFWEKDWRTNHFIMKRVDYKGNSGPDPVVNCSNLSRKVKASKAKKEKKNKKVKASRAKKEKKNKKK